MKGLLRSTAASLLGLLASLIIRKYKPVIVMVTGSVGKTSTKDAVAAALASHGPVRASEKSYNSEFGVPLTIIGAKNPWTSVASWLGVIEQALSLIFLKQSYPHVLVLEVGADRPGDLEKIMRIGTPDAVVVTRLPDVPVHVEAYASTDAVRAEEFTPAFYLPPGAPLILASNNEYALSMGKKTLAKMVTFGFADTADVRIETPEILVQGGTVAGMKAEVHAVGGTQTLVLKGALGRHQVLAPAAAIATALSLGMTFKEAVKGLASYMPPAGRSRLLEGVRNSLLIDDTYNSSPAAAEEALASLGCVSSTGRKIAVLGDMLELGRYSVVEHEKIGVLATKHAGLLVTVGVRSRATAESAIASGMKEENVISFSTAHEAKKMLTELVAEGDVVLIKGSQGMRMERITESLLARPEDTKYLVRQEKQWKSKK